MLTVPSAIPRILLLEDRNNIGEDRDKKVNFFSPEYVMKIYDNLASSISQ